MQKPKKPVKKAAVAPVKKSSAAATSHAGKAKGPVKAPAKSGVSKVVGKSEAKTAAKVAPKPSAKATAASHPAKKPLEKTPEKAATKTVAAGKTSAETAAKDPKKKPHPPDSKGAATSAPVKTAATTEKATKKTEKKPEKTEDHAAAVKVKKAKTETPDDEDSDLAGEMNDEAPGETSETRETSAKAPVDTANADEVILTDADGRRYCRVKDCDQVSTVDGYCRYHYLLFWKNIQNRKKILSEGKLERYVEELTSRYPDKFLELLRKDLRSEKDFNSAIQELEIDDSGNDNEFEDEAQSYLDEVRGMSSEPTSEREEDF